MYTRFTHIFPRKMVYKRFLVHTTRFQRSIFFGSPLPNVYPLIFRCDELQLLIRVRSPALPSPWIGFFPRRPLFLRLLSHQKHTFTLSSLFEQTSQPFLKEEENVSHPFLHSHAKILQLLAFVERFLSFIRISSSLYLSIERKIIYIETTDARYFFSFCFR